MNMPEYTLIPFDDALEPVWNAVVASSRNGNFLHLRDFMGYHAHRFDEKSLIIQKDRKPVAVFPCNLSDDQIVSHGGLTYAGLIYGNDLRSVCVMAIFELMIEHYRKQGYRSILYKAIPHIFHRYPAEEDLYALYRSGARLVRRDLSTAVQLSNRIKLSDSRKNTIRKAVKHGLVIREGYFSESLHALLANVLGEHGAQPVHTVPELQLLQSRFPGRIRLFGAFDGNDLLAGALIFDFDSVAHSQYLASSEDGRQKGALDFLLAHLLDVEFRHHRYFSFGISTEQKGHYLNEGLVFQKEGFGGRAVVHDFYELQL
jgi:hypothetical protein